MVAFKSRLGLKWKRSDKNRHVMSLAADGAAINPAMCRELDADHTWCLAHLLQLGVLDALDPADWQGCVPPTEVQDVVDLLTRARNTISAIKSSSTRLAVLDADSARYVHMSLHRFHMLHVSTAAGSLHVYLIP